MQALIREIQSQGRKFGERPIRSIFFGGGTPSLLTKEQILRIGDVLNASFPYHCENMEWTLEANPGTVTMEKAIAWKEIGINRISMGMQSADDSLLEILGRIHRMKDVQESMNILKEAGFINLNLDLMMGLPGQTLESWKETLRKAERMGVTHLSCYSLIIEEGTPFFEAEERGELDLPEEELERAMYDWTLSFLKEKGFHQYEISNFAKEGRESRHNRVYWELDDYLGLGLGASSLIEGKRLKNETQLQHYIDAEDPVSLQILEEELTEKEAMEEFMFMGLRENEGVSRKRFELLFHTSMEQIYGSVIRQLCSEGLLETTEDRIFLSRRGLDLGNRVFGSFLLD